MLKLGEDDLGGVAGGGGFGEGGEAFFLDTPESGVVFEKVGNGGFDGRGRGGERAGLVSGKELDVALFLTWHDVMDQHGTLGGDGFVNGGTTGFSNHEVMRGKQFGDLAGPPFEMESAGVGLFEGANFPVEPADVSTENGRDPGAGV